MPIVEVELLGAKRLMKALNELPKIVQKKVVRHAVRVGQKIILGAAKDNARSMVGGDMGSRIARALQVRVQKRQKPGAFGMNVQINPAKTQEFIHVAKSGKRTFIVAAIEYGHGNAAAIPFERSAYDEKGQTAINTAVRDLRDGTETEARKLA